MVATLLMYSSDFVRFKICVVNFALAFTDIVWAM